MTEEKKTDKRAPLWLQRRRARNTAGEKMLVSAHAPPSPAVDVSQTKRAEINSDDHDAHDTPDH